MFLFSDTQIKDESFVEDINNLLNSGEVPNLFAQVRRALEGGWRGLEGGWRGAGGGWRGLEGAGGGAGGAGPRPGVL